MRDGRGTGSSEALTVSQKRTETNKVHGCRVLNAGGKLVNGERERTDWRMRSLWLAKGELSTK